jgi:hypothetical protein
MIATNRDRPLSHIGTILLWTWVAFTSFYTLFSFAYPFIQSQKIDMARQSGYNQWVNETTQQAFQSFSGNVFQNGYSSAVTQLVNELAKQYEEWCQKEIPITVWTGSVGVVWLPCLQKILTTTASWATNSTGTTNRSNNK